MKFLDDGCGYRMWLSRHETDRWARRPHAAWPCSALAGKSLTVGVDTNGLYWLLVGGRDGTDVPATELEAVVADHLPSQWRGFWPTWEGEAK